MRTAFGETVGSIVAMATESTQIQFDEEFLEGLRALGYIR